jgi:transporter family protein
VLSALCGGIIGLLLYFHALKIGEANVVIPITASYPLVTALLAMLFLGESVTASRLVGAGLIVAGIYFIR